MIVSVTTVCLNNSSLVSGPSIVQLKLLVLLHLCSAFNIKYSGLTQLMDNSLWPWMTLWCPTGLYLKIGSIFCVCTIFSVTRDSGAQTLYLSTLTITLLNMTEMVAQTKVKKNDLDSQINPLIYRLTDWMVLM